MGDPFSKQYQELTLFLLRADLFTDPLIIVLLLTVFVKFNLNPRPAS